MRPKVMLNIGQQARCFIAGRLDDLTVETRKRLLHERMPRVLIAGVGRLLQDDVVALGFHRHQAQPPGKRFILGQRDVFGGHVFGQTRAFLSAVRHDRLLHLTVDLLLRPIGGRDKAIKAGELQQQTHQANATGTDFGAHQMVSRAPDDARRQAPGHCEKRPRRRDARRGSLGTPAMPAACCGAPASALAA